MIQNSDAFRKELANLVKARFPLIYLPTWEEQRAVTLVQQTLADDTLLKSRKALFIWAMTTGIVAAEGPQRQPIQGDTTDAHKALEWMLAYAAPAVFLMKDLHMVLDDRYRAVDPQLIRRLRDAVPRLMAAGKTILLVSPTLVLPDELQKDVHVLDFALPTNDELLILLQQMVSANSTRGALAGSADVGLVPRIAKAALGLTYQEAENAFAYTLAENPTMDDDDVKHVQRQKEQVIKKSGTLECVDTPLDMHDVGGLDNLKAWLDKRNNTWDDDARRYNLPTPSGVLITGIPGCGKSLIAKAISAEWNLPLLRFDLSRIFSPYVGTSEENMRKSIATAEAIAPCILWVDEIEKGFSGVKSDQDGGAASRVFGWFLTWMQEKQKPVFVVATANNIDALPTELLRKGRFDEIFFVDLPNADERAAIFRIHLEKRLSDPNVRGDFQLSDPAYHQLALLSEGLIGAEIEQAVITGLFEAYAGKRSLRPDDIVKALRETVPLSRTQAENIARMRDWAKTRAVLATSVPQADPPPVAPTLVFPASKAILPDDAALSAPRDAALAATAASTRIFDSF